MTLISGMTEAGLELLAKSQTGKKIFFTRMKVGTGRISEVVMYPMTLFETKDSNGTVSLNDIIEGNDIAAVSDLELEDIASVMEDIIRNCPFIWFKFGNQDLETKLDTVDYADIDASTTKKGESPSTNNC